MTAVFIDPLVGAALVHLGLPILPGLPCPTCGGRRWVRKYPTLLPAGLTGSCPDCTDGVWTPPDSPVPIGVTSAEPTAGHFGGDRWRVGHHRGWWLADEWRVTALLPIVLSSMIGEVTLRPLKVYGDRPPLTGSFVSYLPDWPGYPPLALFDGSSQGIDISSALPFLPGLKPEDTVYLLDGFTESVECPECGGSGVLPLGPEGTSVGCYRCCDGSGRLSCPFPVPAPDHPCVKS